MSTSACRFPTWTHGQWQDAYVEADTLVYKDLRNFRTYTVKCMVEQQSNSQNQGHFVVYARTQWSVSIERFNGLVIGLLHVGPSWTIRFLSGAGTDERGL